MKDNKTGRPTILTILCVVGFIGSFFKSILVISPMVQSHGRWYAVYISLSAAFMILCLCGIWLMKKQGFWGFLTYVLTDQGIYWRMGLWQPQAFLLSFFILVSCLIFYRRMKW